MDMVKAYFSILSDQRRGRLKKRPYYFQIKSYRCGVLRKQVAARRNLTRWLKELMRACTLLIQTNSNCFEEDTDCSALAPVSSE